MSKTLLQEATDGIWGERLIGRHEAKQAARIVLEAVAERMADERLKLPVDYQVNLGYLPDYRRWLGLAPQEPQKGEQP